MIDEFPYLAAKEASIEAILQKVWDHAWQALADQGRPLYDRLREMAIRPLSPAAIGDLLDLAPVDALDAHLVIGDFPALATEWGTAACCRVPRRGAARSDLLPRRQRRAHAGR